MNTPHETLTLRVSGDLLSTNAESVRKESTGLFEAAGKASQKWNTFRLDLTSAKMVDSVGLNLIVTLLKHVEKSGARMQIAYSDQNVQRTFVFTRLEQRVELVKG